MGPWTHKNVLKFKKDNDPKKANPNMAAKMRGERRTETAERRGRDRDYNFICTALEFTIF